MKIQNKTIFASAALLSLLLCGCSSGKGIPANYRAIEDLQTVQTLGIDRDADGGVTLTAAVGKAGDSGSPAVLRRSGRSIPEAIDSLQDYTERGQLFFAHVRYLVLGQDMAVSGMNEVFDYVERDVHTRMGTELFVLRDGRAEDFMRAVADGDAITNLLDAVKRDTTLRGSSHVGSIRNAAVALSEYGAVPVCALRAVSTEDSIFSDAPEQTVVPDGYAILRNGALVSFIGGGDAEALSLLTGNLGTVSRSIPDGAGGTVTLELSGSAAISVSEPTLTEITLALDAVIAAVDAPDAPVTDAAYLETLSAAVSAETEEQVLRVLGLSKSLDADFLPLAPALRRRTGRTTLRSDWLQEMEFRLHTETVMAHSYDMREPLEMEGDG